MPGLKHAVIRAGLETLYFSGAHRMLRPLFGGLGAILTLHHVRPPRPDPFQPNRLLEVTPDFLDQAIRRIKARGIELVSLDTVYQRLAEPRSDRRFVALTFDDGYRDNLDWAYPILKRHEVPFTLFVPTSFPDQQAELWWLTLEEVVRRNTAVAAVIDGPARVLPAGSPAEKARTFEQIYWWLRRLTSETQMRSAVRALAAGHGVDPDALRAGLCLSWDEIGVLAADPLVTIGAHTVSHSLLARLSPAEVRAEMLGGADEIARRLGVRPEHFAYPVGDESAAGPREYALAAELGFKTALTTRPGVLFPAHAGQLTALPRISLNGKFQRLRHLDVLLSGAATACWPKRGPRLGATGRGHRTAPA